MNQEPTEIVLGPEPTAAGEPPARSRGRRLALLLGVLAVLGGGIFAAFSLADEESNTPEEAVRSMLAALEQGDVLGMLEQLDPGERDVLRDPLVELVDELNRLEVLDADLRELSGIELSFRDLDFSVQEVRDGLATVRPTGGRSAYRIDASELPIGSFVRELVGDGLEDSSGEESIASTGADDVVATVRRGGRWYVSIGYSAAESARRGAGVSIAELPEGVRPAGAGSPEEAVRELVEAGTRLDVRRALELLAPDELGALQEYAGLFLADAESAAADGRAELEASVEVLELDSSRSGRRAEVFVRDIALTAEADGQRVEVADGCIRMTVGGREQQRVCQSTDPTELLRDNPIFGTLFSSVEPPKLSFSDARPAIGIATVQVDGKWYVSPVRTSLDAVVELARLFRPEDLRELRRYVTELFEAFTGGFTSVEGSIGGAVGGSTGPDPMAQHAELSACLQRAASEDDAQRCFETHLGPDR